MARTTFRIKKNGRKRRNKKKQIYYTKPFELPESLNLVAFVQPLHKYMVHIRQAATNNKNSNFIFKFQFVSRKMGVIVWALSLVRLLHFEFFYFSIILCYFARTTYILFYICSMHHFILTIAYNI